MKLIALDVGTKRIGVAKADSKVRIAIPYSAVEVDGEEFKKIASLSRAWDITNFVLGLPRSNEGNETKQTAYVKAFARQLKKAIPEAKICFQDESLTSVEAEKRLKNRKKGYKKGDIDSEAAAIILQDFIEEKTGKTTSVAAAARRKTVQGAKPHRLSSVIIALCLLVALAGFFAFGYYSYNLRPVSKVDCSAQQADECDDTEFIVVPGASVAEVADQLKTADLIRNPFIFQIYFRLNSGGQSLKAGTYDFTQAMSVQDITALLLHGADGVFSFTVLPGDTVRNIRANLAEIGYSLAEIDSALSHDYSSESYGWVLDGRPADSTSLEGYLYGDTYEFFNDATAEDIIGRLIAELADVVKKNDLKAAFEAKGLTLYQGITLASVIQKEANSAEDMQKVAQIFLNRLELDMTLGSDVTAIYAADLVDPDRTTLTDVASVLAVDSPYNTRLHAGLPYGPVSNPGLAALEAVAAPDTSMSDMLFFLTGDDGMMYYSSTEEGHNQNRLDHCQELCNVAL